MNKNKEPKISIVTVVYNGETYLERTIKSVLNQTYTNIEYIIVDGGSTDETIEIIKKYKNKIDIWKSEPDNGIYDAMNKSIDLVTGEYVWFINAGDEIYESTTIENILKNFNHEDVYYGKTQLVNENGSYGVVTKTPTNLNWKSFMHGMVVSHQSIIFSTKIIKKYNLDYKLVSDQDWIISILKRSKKIKNTNIILSKYLLGGFSNKNFSKTWKEKLIICKKQYGTYTYILNLIYFIKAILSKIRKV